MCGWTFLNIENLDIKSISKTLNFIFDDFP